MSKGAYPDHAFEFLLMEQHEVFTRAQAFACGVSRGTIRARLDANKWQCVSSGVIVAHNGALDELATIWSVVLTLGRGAVVSHQSAAYFYRLIPAAPENVHISVPAERNPVRRPGIEVHRSRNCRAGLVGRRLPYTSVEDTVLDLVDQARREEQVVAWVVTAISKRKTTAPRLVQALAERSRAHWRGLLDDLLADDEGVESALEWRFLHRVVRAHGLPEGTRQRVVVVGRKTVRRDVDYEEWGVLVELDARVGHDGLGAFKDMSRDNAAAVRGQMSLRYGWFDVAGSACAAAWQLAQVLRARGWLGALRRCPNCPPRS